VSSIQAKANLSPSTVSNYLDTLQRAGLLLSERHGKWTYFRRNEEAIAELARFVGGEL
jgi:ArsR family transcriptional regulator